MAIHSSTLAWKIPWTEEPDRLYSPWGCKESDTTEQLHVDFHQQLYANKMDKLEEMDKFLEKFNFSKLNKEEIENLNRPITSTEIETVVRNLPANKSPGPDGFKAEFYQKFREELTPSLLKLFQKTAEEGKLSVSISLY